MTADYITFDGPDGCGKTTQAAMLAERLSGSVLTREPGGTAVGAVLRSILLDPANGHLAPLTEMLLMQADRAQHIAEIVRPNLEAGRTVISDRSILSTLAYQGYGRGLPLTDLYAIGRVAADGLMPTLAIVIDTPEHVRNARLATKQLDRFELAGNDFQRRVATGFAELARADLPFPVVTVDGSGDQNQTLAQVLVAIAEARRVRDSARNPRCPHDQETTKP